MHARKRSKIASGGAVRAMSSRAIEADHAVCAVAELDEAIRECVDPIAVSDPVRGRGVRGRCEPVGGQRQCHGRDLGQLAGGVADEEIEDSAVPRFERAVRRRRS